MSFSSLRGVERQIFIDTLRLQPEFAAFKRIEAVAGGISQPFSASPGAIVLGDAAFAWPALLGFHLRQALEFAWLLAHGRIRAPRAGLAAARAAAQFITAELDNLSQAGRNALPYWVTAMAGDIAPAAAKLAEIAADFPGGSASPADIAHVRQIWGLLGTAEALMETGGDIRLQRDPRSALNGYGSSHRPRPWAVTFASSTASSSSERGYAAADLARLKATAALLAGPNRQAIAQPITQPITRTLDKVRRFIAAVYGLSPDHAVVLAASGTDTELLALALTHMAEPDAPILNILIAPEETGRGVPMAARGLHFAVDTALGHDVTFEAPIAGFRPDTELANIYLRAADGALRPMAAIEAEITAAVAAGIQAGRKVILHSLDLSKTGLLAPSLAFLAPLRAAYGARFDIVVDACQARLSPASVRCYLELDAVVLITGSKFFTGPPFAGAALIPPAIADRLQSGKFPEGLDAYFGRNEFPTPCQAASRLPATGNYGLALRWHAALAEMQALMRISPSRRAEILSAFGTVVTAKISENPALALLPQPAIDRGAAGEAWERLPTIFSFSLRAPHEPKRFLNPVEARAVYLWLNADLSKQIPGNPIAARICHIGQPVKLPQAAGGAQGVLRVSAGARLISGEPSHKGMGHQARIHRELADLATVFDKIALILAHWSVLCAANPAPCYRPSKASLVAARRGDRHECDNDDFAIADAP